MAVWSNSYLFPKSLASCAHDSPVLRTSTFKSLLTVFLLRITSGPLVRRASTYTSRRENTVPKKGTVSVTLLTRAMLLSTVL